MRLLKSNTLMSKLRRIRWMKWLPPIESASPSPVTTQTESSGLAIFTPEAIVGALP